MLTLRLFSMDLCNLQFEYMNASGEDEPYKIPSFNNQIVTNSSNEEIIKFTEEHYSEQEAKY